MLSRILMILIAAFWVAMTGMLVIREMYPEATRLNTVPTPYVAGLFFQHMQSSDLQVYDNGKEIGYLHLQPRDDLPGETRVMEFHGNLWVHPLGGQRQRLGWTGAIHLTDKLQMQTLNIMVTTQSPPTEVDLTLNFVTRTAQYRVQSGGSLVDASTISMDRAGVGQILQRLGIDPALLLQAERSAAATPEPEFTAQQSSVKLNGEIVSTYLLSMRLADQSLFEAHVSQLGQVLRAEIPLMTYKLVPYNVRP